MSEKLYIYPSLLAADFGNLETACRTVKVSGADGIHLDVMDGHFVPNLSMGPQVVEMASRVEGLHLNTHLMVTHPQNLVQSFIDAGSHTILIHIEADCDVKQVLSTIRAAGCRTGITLNPATPASSITDILDVVDEVLCMTVVPGFGGQSFMPEVLPKIAEIRAALTARSLPADIMVDGGINAETGAQCVAAGANILVAGTFLFRSSDMAAEIENMRSVAAGR